MKANKQLKKHRKIWARSQFQGKTTDKQSLLIHHTHTLRRIERIINQQMKKIEIQKNLPIE